MGRWAVATRLGAADDTSQSQRASRSCIRKLGEKKNAGRVRTALLAPVEGALIRLQVATGTLVLMRRQAVRVGIMLMLMREAGRCRRRHRLWGWAGVEAEQALGRVVDIPCRRRRARCRMQAFLRTTTHLRLI